MEPSHALSLLGGLTPQQFMRRHWQKKPLLVRRALPDLQPFLRPAELFALAGQQDVESRLVVRQPARGGQERWQMRSGPLARRALPPLKTPGWTLLVQGVDLHSGPAHQLMQLFRFIPDARLDDLMVSYASAGGGVGPHFDSYDVFLLQASGSRRWQIGAQSDLSLKSGLPLKILRDFKPQQEFVIHAGDMLYLPPRYAHDGIAVRSTDAQGREQPCMTYSIGFRSPARHELAGALLTRMAEGVEDAAAEQPSVLYRDPMQLAATAPAAMPPALLQFARDAVERILRDPQALPLALGQYLTEPKPTVWFDGADHAWVAGMGVRLHQRTRMLYDEHHVFINGEGFNARGRDARLLRELADVRRLPADRFDRLSAQAREVLCQWLDDGWLVPDSGA